MLMTDILKNSAAGLPLLGQFVRLWRLSRGYDQSKDSSRYVQSVFDRLAEALRSVQIPIAGDFLEIGPGGNLGVAMRVVAAGGSSVTSIDVMPWAQKVSNLNQGADLAWTLAAIRYVTPCDIEDSGFPDGSFDVIFSHACFEHFKNPMRAVSEISRLLRPGGITVHQIDLRDHRNFATPLAHLQYPPLVWQLATSNRNCGGNRWRASDYELAFTEHGLQTRMEVTESLPTLDATPTIHKSISVRAPSDLTTLGINIIATKPL